MLIKAIEMKKIVRFCAMLFCSLLVIPIFLPSVVYAAPASISYAMYSLNSCFPNMFLFTNGSISLNVNDFLIVTFFTKYRETEVDSIDVSLYLHTSNNYSPFNSLITKKKQTIDLKDSNNFTSIAVTTPTIYFDIPGTYPITAEIENLTTGGTTTFQFTVVVMGCEPSSTPPIVDISSSSSIPSSSSSSSPTTSISESSSDDDSSEIILQPDPVDPTPPDPPLLYQPKNDPLWLDLLDRLSKTVSGLFPIYIDNPDASYLPSFITEVLFGKDINLLINYMGIEYVVNGLALTRVYLGVDIPYTELPSRDDVATEPSKMERQNNIIYMTPNERPLPDTPFHEVIEPATNTAGKAALENPLIFQSIALPYRTVPVVARTKDIRAQPLPLASNPTSGQLLNAVPLKPVSHNPQIWATVPVVAGVSIFLTILSKRVGKTRFSRSKKRLVVVKP